MTDCVKEQEEKVLEVVEPTLREVLAEGCGNNSTSSNSSVAPRLVLDLCVRAAGAAFAHDASRKPSAATIAALACKAVDPVRFCACAAVFCTCSSTEAASAADVVATALARAPTEPGLWTPAPAAAPLVLAAVRMIAAHTAKAASPTALHTLAVNVVAAPLRVLAAGDSTLGSAAERDRRLRTAGTVCAALCAAVDAHTGASPEAIVDPVAAGVAVLLRSGEAAEAARRAAVRDVLRPLLAVRGVDAGAVLHTALLDFPRPAGAVLLSAAVLLRAHCFGAPIDLRTDPCFWHALREAFGVDPLICNGCDGENESGDDKDKKEEEEEEEFMEEENDEDDTRTRSFAVSCGLELMRAGVLTQGSDEKEDTEFWGVFVEVWEALQTHSMELVRPAWGKLLLLARHAPNPRLPWVALLFRRALAHFHAPTRRAVLLAYLHAGAAAPGPRLAAQPAFLARVAFAPLADRLLWRGDFRARAPALVRAFLRSFLASAPEAARPRVLAAYLRRIAAAPLDSAAVLTHLRCLEDLFGDDDLALTLDTAGVSAFVAFAARAADAQHPVVRAAARERLAALAPRVLRAAQQPVALAPVLALARALGPALRRTPLCRTALAALVALVSPKDAVSNFVLAHVQSCEDEDDEEEKDEEEDELVAELVLALPSSEAVATLVETLAHTPGASRLIAAAARLHNDDSSAFSGPLAAAVAHAVLPRTAAALAAGPVRCPAALAACAACATHLDDSSTAQYRACVAAQVQQLREAVESSGESAALSWATYCALVNCAAVAGTPEGAEAAKLARALVPIVARATPKTLVIPHSTAGRGARWAAALDDAVCALATLLEHAPETGNADTKDLWESVAMIVEQCPGRAAAAQLLASTARALSHNALARPSAETLEQVQNAVFERVGAGADASSDGDALVEALCALALQPRVADHPECAPVLETLVAGVLRAGARSARAVNALADALAAGGADAWAAAHADALLAVLLFGPVRGAGDTALAGTAVFDDDHAEPSALGLARPAVVARARATREHYARLVLAAHVRAQPTLAASCLARAVACAPAVLLVPPRRMPLHSARHRAQIRLAQVLAALAPRVPDAASATALTNVSLRFLAEESHFATRFYVLLILARIACARPELLLPEHNPDSSSLWDSLVDHDGDGDDDDDESNKGNNTNGKNSNGNPNSNSSKRKSHNNKMALRHAALVVLGTVAANCVETDAGKEIATRLVPRALPLVAGPLAVRLAAQGVFSALVRAHRVPPSAEGVAGAVAAMLQPAADVGRALQTVLTALALGAYLPCTLPALWHDIPLLFHNFPLVDVAPVGLAADAEGRFPCPAPRPALPHPPVALLPDALVPGLEAARARAYAADGANGAAFEAWDISAAARVDDTVQTKPAPACTDDDGEDAVGTDSLRAGHREYQDLILVATLVDKPPNLGGMCRTCDVCVSALFHPSCCSWFCSHTCIALPQNRSST